MKHDLYESEMIATGNDSQITKNLTCDQLTVESLNKDIIRSSNGVFQGLACLKLYRYLFFRLMYETFSVLVFRRGH